MFTKVMVRKFTVKPMEFDEFQKKGNKKKTTTRRNIREGRYKHIQEEETRN